MSRSRRARRRLASVLRKSRPGLRLNEHLEHPEGVVVFQHACQLGCEGIVSKRLGSRYRSGRSPDWLKFKNPAAPAVRREEEEEDWGRWGNGTSRVEVVYSAAVFIGSTTAGRPT